jgi:hypothetical protein
MSYKYTKGYTVQGDIKAADDTERNTIIDFGEDKIDLQTSGTVRIRIDNDGVYIPDTAADYSLKVSGAIEITPGTNAGITFKKTESEINFIKFANASDGTSYNAYLAYQATEHLYISPGRGADFYINSRTSVSEDPITFPFRIMDDGTARFEKNLSDATVAAASIASDISFYVSGTTDGNNNAVFLGRTGVGTSTPKTALDVHHDPTALANDTGGGEVVNFGSGTLTAGKLYYLSGSAWTETDADGVLQGADQLLGIALGSSPTTNGVLLRGFFDAHSYLSNFSAGKAVYVSTTAAGMDTTAPSGGGDFVRIVGYCTTTANVIYFNPSTTWIEL